MTSSFFFAAGCCAQDAAADSANSSPNGVSLRHVRPRFPRGREQILQRHPRIEYQVEESDHHLVPTLVAPDHVLRRIGIERVVGRVVEVRGAFDIAPLGSAIGSLRSYQSCQVAR